MISKRQRKGVVIGLIWSLVAWVPFYTNYLGGIRKYIGIPATLGLNLELALNWGDAFIFSLFLGVGIVFFIASLMDLAGSVVKIIGLLPLKKSKYIRRGL